MASAIELRDVSKTFKIGKQELNVLRNIDLLLEEGEFLAIMGPSGSGKTTLMNLMGLLDSPTSGSVLINGKEIANKSQKDLVKLRCSNIGFVFQQFHLIPSLTAYENVALPTIFAKLNGVSQNTRILEALKKVGLEHRMNHKPFELSGGEQQRVAIARALVLKPKIILADEPTGALDQKTGESIIQLLSKLAKEGYTIAMVTHNPVLARQVNRIVQLCDGKIAGEEKQ